MLANRLGEKKRKEDQLKTELNLLILNKKDESDDTCGLKIHLRAKNKPCGGFPRILYESEFVGAGTQFDTGIYFIASSQIRFLYTGIKYRYFNQNIEMPPDNIIYQSHFFMTSWGVNLIYKD